MTENKAKLLDQVRRDILVKYYSLRAEESYINWIKRVIFFYKKKHPLEMGENESVDATMIYTNVIKFVNSKQLTIIKRHGLGS